jgi:hypothetical protein
MCFSGIFLSFLKKPCSGLFLTINTISRKKKVGFIFDPPFYVENTGIRDFLKIDSDQILDFRIRIRDVYPGFATLVCDQE